MRMKRGVISVCDKRNVVGLVKEVREVGVEVIWRGGRKKVVQEKGVDVMGI
ncbi:hypothetical protein [Bacillus velezensis]|uniref:hypothetical protein n=1 Tax=Bacillus velezensis TaxID=492670 RepID=UPI001643FA46